MPRPFPNAVFAVLALASALPAGALAAPPAPLPLYASAVADTGRPEADRVRDANRKPEAVLSFMGLTPGQKVFDYSAGSGYFTRLFATAVGPTGHVYASVPSNLAKFPEEMKGLGGLDEYAGAHPNVGILFAAPMDAARAPEPLDVFFISQFYHDLHDPFMGPVDIIAFNRTVYAGLKPGGLYVVLDHVAAKGSPADVTDTLHRIEPGVARREIEAAGFVFVDESPVLVNPADPRTKIVFDTSIRGRTDQFLMKFRKPAQGISAANASR